MAPSSVQRVGARLVLLAGLAAGCATPSRPAMELGSRVPAASAGSGAASADSSPFELPAVRLASATSDFADPADRPAPAPASGTAELSVEALVEQVLARNPTLAQMAAVAQAAAARYPQVTSLDDPMFGAQVAPHAWNSGQVSGGYRVEIAQKYPWPGKLALRGETARAEAAAAGREVDDARLQLIESARSAFYEYYLVDRALEVNREALRLLGEFRQNAETRYKTGLVPQQDLLQADVEIGQQRERQVRLERMREVAVARLNTLMHLPTDGPLPPPPERLDLGGEVPAAAALQAEAVARRPDLQALADRIAAEQASLALAEREFYPDAEVMAAYDRFWQERDLRSMVGVRVNLPVRQERRHGAVAEAQARVAQRRAEFDRLRDQVNLQVKEAHAQVRESEQVVRLYAETIVPAAEANVKSAQTAYTTGKIPFLSLIEAQRGVVTLRDRYYEALADYFRRRAALDRAVGGPVPAHPPAAAPDKDGKK